MDQSLVHTFSWENSYGPMVLKVFRKFPPTLVLVHGLVAHDCGYPLSRYTCRATRVAADFLDFIAFCRCSTGVALHPLKILVSHLPPPCAGRCRTEIWLSEKVSRYTGVSQLQLRVSRYTAQLRSMDGSSQRIVETVVLENGVFVPYRKQVVLTRTGENSDSAFYPQNKGPCSSDPGNRRKL